IDLHVHDGDGRADGDRQLELNAALDFGLFEPQDLSANALGLALDGLRRYMQSGQQFQLLTANTASGLTANHCHACVRSASCDAHPARTLRAAPPAPHRWDWGAWDQCRHTRRGGRTRPAPPPSGM